MAVLAPGTSCWRTARAARVGVLVDAVAYYQALREVALSARHSLIIAGWDVDSRTPLVPDTTPADGYPQTLLPFLNALLERRSELRVHVLGWDFSMIYALEREPLASIKFGWKSHARLDFALDAHHAQGASHHQKLVVADDRVAFCGGVDLTIRRWDTPEHLADDPRRRDPRGDGYAPMHDVHAVLDGEAARALGQLVRARWAAATGEPLPSPARGGAGAPRLFRRSRPAASSAEPEPDPWPASAAIDFRDVDVGIVRNYHAVAASETSVHEVSAFNLAAIASARRSIFVEQQYLTSAAVGEALARRLGERDGPEVVAVLPKFECGWMEQSSMGMMRARMLARLRRADEHGHLHIYYPVVPGLGEACLNVHSKVMIVDDRVLKIGSSNLSNRSLGLDTECDLVIEAREEEAALRRDITAILCRLLGEHLALSPAQVAARLLAHGSIAKTIEGERGRPRCLEPLDLETGSDAPVDLAMLDGVFADPEQPIDADAFMERLVPPDARPPTRRSLYGVVAVVGAILLLTSAWRFTPLVELASAERVAEFVRALRGDPFAAFYVWLIYVVAAGAFFPITALIAGTALAFDPLRALAFSLLGALSSAAISYALGRALGQAPLRRFGSARLRKLHAPIRKHGFRTIVTARILPLGNFTAINLLAGALRVPFRAYLLGNVVGLLPGIVGLSVLTNRLVSALARPSAFNVAILLACLAGVAWGLWRIKRGLDRRADAPRHRISLASDARQAE